MEINKNIASLLSGKEKLSIDDGTTSEMLSTFFFPYKSDGSWRLALLIQAQKGQISAPCGNSLDKPEAFRSAEHI